MDQKLSNVMAGGGGVEDAPLINDPTLITHNRSD